MDNSKNFTFFDRFKSNRKDLSGEYYYALTLLLSNRETRNLDIVSTNILRRKLLVYQVFFDFLSSKCTGNTLTSANFKLKKVNCLYYVDQISPKNSSYFSFQHSFSFNEFLLGKSYGEIGSAYYYTI